MKDTIQFDEKLIQEDYLDNPWAMLVCCILLNQTNNKQVRPVLNSVFTYIPDARRASDCDPQILAGLIKSTGFQNVKSTRIIKLSKKWIDGFETVDELPGIGKYGRESWDIFVDRNFDINPTDKKLSLFLHSGGPDRITSCHSALTNS